MSFFKQVLRSVQGKPRIKVSSKLLLNGRLDQRKYDAICKNVERVLIKYDKAKIGETANPSKRITYDDYLDHYSFMFLLYQSKSKNDIDELEVDLIDEYYNDIENVKDTRGGMMRAVKGGTYYVYIVAD